MVIVMSAAASQADIAHVLERLAERSCRGELTVGVERTIITVVGPKPPALADDVRALPHVDNVVLLGKSYELAGRETKPAGSVVHVGNVAIGGDALVLIAGPGTVESEEQVVGLARSLRESGAQLLAGGAMRPDQSPYAFRGLGEEGLRHLAAARAATGLPVISDVSSTVDVEIVARYADALEVGPFHMRNFGLLEAVAASGKPVLLRRALSATVDEWLLCAEHILYGGNDQVILCETGIRTFEPATPTTTDISAVPVLKQRTHLPVVVDPARSAGRASLVEPLAMAAVAATADGLIVEVHPDPEHALADGPQSLTPAQFARLAQRLTLLAPALGRRLPPP